MYNGNPNATNPYAPKNPAKSRFNQGRADPFGVGIESLQGDVMQGGPKINSIPGYGKRPEMAESVKQLVEARKNSNRVRTARSVRDLLDY